MGAFSVIFAIVMIGHRQLHIFGSQRVIPVIRTTTAASARTAVDWLHLAGFNTAEITLTIPDAIALIDSYRDDQGIIIGAGSVMSEADAERCLQANARFIVSPVTAPSLVGLCHEARIPCLLGAYTPTEVHNAATAGADAVKIFPASSAGGPAHIHALKAVFPSVPLVPTGGIGRDDIDAYLQAGAALVGVGGNLINEELIRDGARDAFVANARGYRAAAAQA